MSLFHHVKEHEEDTVYGLFERARADTHPNKVDLSVGAYRDGEGKSVRQVKQRMAMDEDELEEYLPLQGNQKFAKEARDLLFLADDNRDRYEELSKRICSYHCVSATNALYCAMTLLKENVPFTKYAYASDPCWPTYWRLSANSGLQFGKYPYFSSVEEGINIEGMLDALRSYEKGSVIILQASCHNPTGFDPTPEQWERIRDVIIEAELIPLIDIAYQGLGSGGVKHDSLALRIFLEKEMDFFVAQSFSKNMRLYSARVGVLHCVCKSDYIQNQHILMRSLGLIGRGRFGSATRHGSEIAYQLLSDPTLYKMWMEELKEMAQRITDVRKELRRKLEEKKVRGKWDHLTRQVGMFAFLGISEEEVKKLQDEYHIYMSREARISVAALNPSNIDYFVESLLAVRGEGQ
ncbi:pyridoxal phosphate-dependent transferase [Babesia gibsoni]|uniref:Pyridoxal phosphate-dependent transferase n=1 Tax=Babesia gibsoni TaxID=33632 RepID=A0AAD8UQW6_BABGI|nr:pyridoxal phosphate-dependent transferase [Babesia gibsoni]